MSSESPAASFLKRKTPVPLLPFLDLGSSLNLTLSSQHSDLETAIVKLLDKMQRDRAEHPAQAFAPTTYSRIQYCPPRKDTLGRLPPMSFEQQPYSQYPPTPGVGQPPAYPFYQPDSRPTETALPIPANSSIFLHKGFSDLVSLAGSVINRYPASSPALGRDGGYFAAASNPQPLRNPWEGTLRQQPRAATSPQSYKTSPASPRSKPHNKRLSVDMISRPTGFA